MADSSIVDLDPNLVCLWWCDLDVLDGKVFASFPSNSSLFNSSLAIASHSSAPLAPYTIGMYYVKGLILTLQVIVCFHQ